MNNSHGKKLIQLESLDNIQIEGKPQELSLEEVSFIQGGMMAQDALPLSPEKYLELIKQWREKYHEGSFEGLCPYLPVIL